MQVQALKTPIIKPDQALRPIIKQAIQQVYPVGLPEKSVLVVTSKIIAYAQGRLVAMDMSLDHDQQRSVKQALVKQEADLYLDPQGSQYQLMLTVTNHTLAVNAGLDESNADEHYVLWPQAIYGEAVKIWQDLRQDFAVKEVGVIITDSRSIPLRWGVVGTALASCGFQPLNDRIGDLDLFGRPITMVKVNVAEALAVAGVLEMGEVDEQTPLALITDSTMVQFMDRPLSEDEIGQLNIDLADDMYGPLLNHVPWQKGGGQGSK